MKIYLHIVFVFVFTFSCHLNAQIGISTESPEKMLDVNGELRVRTIPESNATATRFLQVDSQGNVVSKATQNVVLNISGGFSRTYLTTRQSTNRRTYIKETFDTFNFVVTENSNACFVVNAGFNKFKSKSGSGFLKDGRSKSYYVTLQLKKDLNPKEQIFINKHSFRNRGTQYVEGTYTAGGLIWKKLTPGNYEISVGRHIEVEPLDKPGFSTIANGKFKNGINLLQVVLLPN